MDDGRIVADGPTERILTDDTLLEAHGLERALALGRRALSIAAFGVVVDGAGAVGRDGHRKRVRTGIR